MSGAAADTGARTASGTAPREERILHVEAERLEPLFGDDAWIGAESARDVVRPFTEEGRFAGRRAVEDDAALVQAVPVVVVRSRRGDVLLPTRREPGGEGALDGRAVVWADGHAREEDADGGDPIGRGAERELGEELGLDAAAGGLRLLGAIWVRRTGADGGGKTARHVALVHEWRAAADEIEVAPSRAEFRAAEPGAATAVFVDAQALPAREDRLEAWSAEIVRRLPPGAETGAGSRGTKRSGAGDDARATTLHA